MSQGTGVAPGRGRLPARLALALSLGVGACGERAPPSPRDARAAHLRDGATPASMLSCQECHPDIVDAFLGHGMAQSLGPLDHRPTGELRQPVQGNLYAFGGTGDTVLASATRPDGGVRVAGVVGRYGAGILDTSYVATELTPDGQATHRLSFLPMESIVGHGLAFAPFEATHPGTGFDMPFNAECLRCHTTQDVSLLPGAARDPGSGHVWPGTLLGSDAFLHLEPLACDACHGEVDHHAELKRASLKSGAPSSELGLERLAELPAPRQRDICARCHLQGEGHIELADVARGGPQPDDALARRPVLVPAVPADDYRFVGQVQRLSLSACFAGSPSMTCTTCHDPHRSVAAQGTADFDARCRTCHDASHGCVRPRELEVRDVTGEPARTVDGCVDCHVRRSQPFDLPHVRTADHHVRRRIAPPSTEPMRAWEDVEGELVVFDDGRIADTLATEEGRAWERGLVAMALHRMGRIEEAAAAMATFPEPGSAEATRTPTGAGEKTGVVLPPLQRSPEFHHARGLVLESVGEPARARAAYGDALLLDPGHPAARLNRARLRIDTGDLDGALADAEELIMRYPRAEKPWNVRARAAALAGDVPAAAAALARSAELWPSDAAVWHELGRLLLRLGHADDARAALARAAALEPSRPGLAADLAVAGG